MSLTEILFLFIFYFFFNLFLCKIISEKTRICRRQLISRRCSNKSFQCYFFLFSQSDNFFSKKRQLYDLSTKWNTEITSRLSNWVSDSVRAGQRLLSKQSAQQFLLVSLIDTGRPFSVGPPQPTQPKQARPKAWEKCREKIMWKIREQVKWREKLLPKLISKYSLEAVSRFI